MNKSSQKRTRNSGALKSFDGSVRDKMGHFANRNEKWTARAITNKFEGMSDHLETVTPVHIPGYKLRG